MAALLQPLTPPTPSWYILCGKAHTDHATYLAAVVSLGAAASLEPTAHPSLLTHPPLSLTHVSPPYTGAAASLSLACMLIGSKHGDSHAASGAPATSATRRKGRKAE